jgi:uncharacterized protein (TIGR03435 family)
VTLLRTCACLFLAGATIAAQAAPHFDVASIRPSAPTPDAAVAAGVRITGSQVRIVSLSLRDYVSMAYKVPPSQVSAPEWMAVTRFDITGNLPDGSTREQVGDMMQALLEERFQMKAHREQREFPIYALVVDKGGPKLKPSADLAAPTSSAIEVGGSGSAAGVNLDLGNGTSFTLANNRIEGRKITLTQLADVLTRFADRHVQDATGLDGRYDLSVDLTADEYQATLIRSAVNAGVVLPPQALRLLDAGPANPLGPALQKAGLGFESRRAPLDVVVVDSSLKAPTEN